MHIRYSSWPLRHGRFGPWIVFHALASAAIIAAQFAGLDRDSVLLIHDQYFPLSAEQAWANLDIISGLNGGTPNGLLFAINGLDSLAYAALYGLGLESRAAEMVYLFVLLATALILAHYGWHRLLASGSYLASLLPTIAFLFSPFLLLQYNTGVFWSMANMLAMAAVPVTVALWRDVVSWAPGEKRPPARDTAALGACLAIYGFAMAYAFPVAVAFCGFVMFMRPAGVHYGALARRLLPSFGIAFALAVPPIFAAYIERYSFGYSFAAGPLASSAAESIRGSVLTPLLQHASWTIYALWSPRVMVGFPSHFSSPAFVSLALMQVALVAAVAILFRNCEFLASCLFGLVVSLFAAKAGNEPFGGLFSEALKHFSVLGLIRNPDSKFGLTIAFFIIAILSWGLTEALDGGRRYLAVLLAGVLLAFATLNAALVLDGRAIRGENGELSEAGSFAFPIDKSFMEAVSFMHATVQDGAVYFATWGGASHSRTGLNVLLKDPLADFVTRPVYFGVKTSAAKSVTAQYISDLIENFENSGDDSSLRKLGVRHIVVNLGSQQASAALSLLSRSERRVVFGNDRYRIFEVPGVEMPSPVALAAQGDATRAAPYRKLLDTMYEVEVSADLADRVDLVLSLANSPQWRVVAADSWLHAWARTLWKDVATTQDAHSASNGVSVTRRPDSGFNEWSIERHCAIASGSKHDSSCSTKFFLIFAPQVLVFALALLSAVSLGVLACLALARRPPQLGQAAVTFMKRGS